MKRCGELRLGGGARGGRGPEKVCGGRYGGEWGPGAQLGEVSVVREA